MFIGSRDSRPVVLNIYITPLDQISHEEILDVDVACPLAVGRKPIIRQQHGALVFLIDHAVMDVIPLYLKEVMSPQDLWHTVIDPDEFVLSRTPCIDLLAGRQSIDCIFTQEHLDPSVALDTGLFGEDSINPTLNDL